MGPQPTPQTYVEIFDARSSNRLVAAFSDEFGYDGSAGYLTWSKDRFFVLPYSPGANNGDMGFCFLGILPED
jgi:hypothetical protein